MTRPQSCFGHWLILQKVAKGCKKLAQKMSCMEEPFVPPVPPRESTPTPPHYSTGKGPADDDEEQYFYEQGNVGTDDSTSDDAPGYEAPEYGIHLHQSGQRDADFLNMSQLHGAPVGTQGEDQVITIA